MLHLPPAALRMTDLNFSKVNYDPLKAYKGSKMALALFAKELAARTVGSNITVYAADPGNTGGCKAGLFSVQQFAALLHCVLTYGHRLTK